MKTPAAVHHRTIVFGEIEESGALWLGFAEDVEDLARDDAGNLSGVLRREVVASCIVPRNVRINVPTIVKFWKGKRLVPYIAYHQAVMEGRAIGSAYLTYADHFAFGRKS